MKLSNNALNFLLAQYRAIFKRAYVKGLASAVILTAGLAAGSAQAVTVNDIGTINSSTDNIFEIDGDATEGNTKLSLKVSSGDTLIKDIEITVGNKDHYIQTASTATPGSTVELDAKDHNLTISDDNNKEGVFTFGGTKVKSKLQIKDLGTLTIDGATVNLNTADSGTNSQGNQVGVDVGAAHIIISNGAQVNLNNNTSKNANTANTLLRGTVMEVTGANTVVNIGNSSLDGSTSAKNSKAVFGYEEEYKDDGSLKYSGSDITVSGATLNLQGVVVAQNIDSQNTVLSGTKGYAARIQGKTLNMTDATLNVKAKRLSGSGGGFGGAGGILAVHKSTLTDSYLTIADQATLNLELREFNKENYYEATENEAGDDTAYNGRDYNGSLTIDGGVVVIDGVLRHTKGGLLEIKDGTQLTGGEVGINPASDQATKNEHKLNNAIMLGVYGDAANPNVNNKGSFANSKLTTLRLSSNTLDQFLNSTDEVITDKDGGKITDYKGQLLVHYGARIELTDSQQVEMSKFTFDNRAGAGHINTTIGDWNDNGHPIISGDQALIGNPKDPNGQIDGTRTIMASNMSIGQTLLAVPDAKGTEDWKNVKSGNSSLAFRFEANDLTLGSEKGTLLEDTKWQGFDSENSVLGALELKAHRSVTFVDGRGNDFTLQDKVVLDTTLADSDTVLGSGNGDNTGTLSGDNIIIGTNSTAGEISVEGGAWTNTQGQSITLTSGTLSISAQAGDKKTDGVNSDGSNNATYYSNGVGSSLTLHGGSFKIDGSADDKASITITGKSGATAFLDLRDTGVTAKLMLTPLPVRVSSTSPGRSSATLSPLLVTMPPLLS